MRRPGTGWWAVLILSSTVPGDRAWRSSPSAHRAPRGGRGTIEPSAAEPLPGRPIESSRAHTVVTSFSRGPLSFDENRGQADPAVEFLARSSEYQLFLTADGATLVRSRPAPSPRAGANEPPAGVGDPRHVVSSEARDDASGVGVLRMRLLGVNPRVRIAGLGEQPGKVHYFQGSDPATWLTTVSTFARVRYAEVYPGVDLFFYGRDGQLEYDFVVAPGINPATIALDFDGADHLAIDGTGDLILEMPDARLVQPRPLVYQQIGGVQHVVKSEYVLTDGRQVGFAIGSYDRDEPLIIDPVLVYSTFLGGTGGSYGEQGYGVATDALDNVYITGQTRSAIFPVGGGGVPSTSSDAFVVKLTASGALDYVTVIQGNASDSGEGIAVDASGRAFVTGFTDSTDFPTRNPTRGDRPGRDAFLMKLDRQGLIVYSTYLGGNSSVDYGESVAVDGLGNAYVTGTTGSTDFPILNALQPVNLGQDAFVAKVDPVGNLLYSTYLGGSADEAAESIVVDAAGSFYVAGWTTSTDFPQAQSSRAKQGGEDVFVSQYAADGQRFVYSRYLGGNSDEEPFAIALDGVGGVYVGGNTDSTNFPAVRALQGDQPGTDAFLTRLGPMGVVSFSTYLGGGGWERILGLSARNGSLFATGQTFSTDFPSIDASQPTKAGDLSTADAFVVRLDIQSGQLVSSTYLGGSATDEGRGATALAGGDVFVAGWTESTDFPTVDPIQDFKSNVGNVFVSRLAPVVGNAPQITEQPVGQTIASGQSASLSVTATGTPPLTYQWYLGPSGTTSNPIPGATTSSFTTPALTIAASYWVRVSNGFGTADSATVEITVAYPAFTDPVLTAGVTPIRAVHLLELRSRIGVQRVRFGLAVVEWTDATLGAGETLIRQPHLLQLRNALSEAYEAAHLTLPAFTDPGLPTGTPLKTVHIQELRDAIIAFELQ